MKRLILSFFVVLRLVQGVRGSGKVSWLFSGVGKKEVLIGGNRRSSVVIGKKRRFYLGVYLWERKRRVKCVKNRAHETFMV
jgi:hypothetical protein